MNSASGSYSFVAGQRAKAEHFGTFLFADLQYHDFNSVGPNEFAVRCAGGAHFVTQIDGSGNPTKWAYLNPTTAAWTVETASDRNLKTSFTPVDRRGVLERLASISIETWNYKGQDQDIRHIGPMAQDFYSAFGLGRDEKYIDTADADGVALAAIQGLYELVKEKEAEITRLRQEKDNQIAELEARLAALEAMVK